MPVEAKEPDKESALHFYTASKLLHIKSTRPIRDSKMKIYGLNGQLHKSIALNENSNKITIDLQDLPEGLFVFQFVGSEISRSEIMSVF